MAKAEVTFAIYRGHTLERRQVLLEDIIKLGSDPGSHVHLDDPAAARLHAVIEVLGPRHLMLIDLGHGTRVNGTPVHKRELFLGDRLQIGTAELVLEGAETTLPLDADSDTCTYAMIKTGPEVQPGELELSHVDSVEVMVMWGMNVLHVAHLTPPRPFYVGEETAGLRPDFVMPADLLGTDRLPLVKGGTSGIFLVVPPVAKGRVDLPDQPTMTLDQVRQRAVPCPEVDGACQVPLPRAGRGRVELGGFVFQVSAVHAGKPFAKGLGANWDWAAPGYLGLSVLTVGAFMGALAFFVPPQGVTEDEGLGVDRLYLIQQYLKSAAEREYEERLSPDVAYQNPDEHEGGTGTRSLGEEGQMGHPTSQAKNRRYAIAGPRHNPDPHLSRLAALEEARRWGMIGILTSGAVGDPNAPTAPWGRDNSLGRDELSARGNMWGDSIGEAFGAGGLGLTGIGEGGGGIGFGVGLGGIGTLGHGAGTGTNQGFGQGHGRLGRGHDTTVPQMRIGQSRVSGRLPPEVVQRIVRQNYGRFRMCYERGLTENPNLEGRVSVRFVIGRDGSVSNVSNGGSDLPSSSVVSCVISAYYGLSFPQPEGGIVTVVYPIMFTPG